MSNFNINNYGIFDNAASVVLNTGFKIIAFVNQLDKNMKNISSEEVLVGNLSDLIISNWSIIKKSINDSRGKFDLLSPHLKNVKNNYKQTDNKVSKLI